MGERGGEAQLPLRLWTFYLLFMSLASNFMAIVIFLFLKKITLSNSIIIIKRIYKFFKKILVTIGWLQFHEVFCCI